jgi:probable HAF family extracellular repeat protein
MKFPISNFGGTRYRLLLCLVVIGALLVVTPIARVVAQDWQQPHYRVVNLGNLSGASSFGNTINNIGWSMGAANITGNTIEHATVWIYGLRFDLGTLGGPNSDVAWPVKNDHGLIAGFSETGTLDPLQESWSCTNFEPTFPVPTGYDCVGFRWQWGVMSALPTLGGNNGFAAGVNNEGEIAGWAENNVHDSTCAFPQVLQFEPVVYGPGPTDIRQLPNYPGDPDGAATAINDKGEVVGISGICDVAVGAFTATHALLWDNGAVVNLGNLGGGGWNTPMAINRRGDIVGFSDLAGDVVGGVLTPNFHAFIWTKETGKMIDIGVLPGDSLSEALDINDDGVVVGVSIPSFHGFIYKVGGTIQDVNSFIPKSSPLVVIGANGINDRGEITGQGCVIADGGCPIGANTPAVLMLPAWNADANEEESLQGDPANVPVPESLRQQLMRRLAFGHFGTEPVRPR